MKKRHNRVINQRLSRLERKQAVFTRQALTEYLEYVRGLSFWKRLLAIKLLLLGRKVNHAA